MRRKDKQISLEEAYRVVDTCAYMVLSMANEDGTPYGVPLSMAREGDCLYFHGAKQGLKMDILRRNPHVSVCCVGSNAPLAHAFSIGYESAILAGEATELTDDAEKKHALRCICERYCADQMEKFDGEVEKYQQRTSVWRIRILETTGKRNAD